MGAPDQFFDQIGAHLVTLRGPYNPWAKKGDRRDPAHFLANPGYDFHRPWLAVRNGPAFMWPLGMQGFSDVISPSLGIHKAIGGGSNVTIDVMHAGEEHMTLSGSFPGDSAAALIKALRTVVYFSAPDEGKILYLPEIADHPWRVQVVSASLDRQNEDRGNDTAYSIEFVRMGTLGDITGPKPPPEPGTRVVKVTAKHDTLRNIALWKLNASNKWRILYDLNQHKLDKFMRTHHVNFHKLPTAKLPIGMSLHY